MMLLTEEDSCTSEDLFDVLMVIFLLIKVIPPVDRILAFDKPIALIHYTLGFCKLKCDFRFCTLNGGTGCAGQPQRVHLAPFEMSPADLTQWNSSDLRFHRQQFIFAWIGSYWKRLQKAHTLVKYHDLGEGKGWQENSLKLFLFKTSIRRVRVECSVSQRYLSGMVCEGAFVLVALSGELPKLGCKEFSGLLASSPRDLWLGRPPPTEPLNEPGAELEPK